MIKYNYEFTKLEEIYIEIYIRGVVRCRITFTNFLNQYRQS